MAASWGTETRFLPGSSRVLNQSDHGESKEYMNRGTLLCRGILCAMTVLVLGSPSLWAQKSAAPSRIVEAVDDTRTVRLTGNVHPLAKAAYDQGALPDSQPLTRMLLLLQRSAAQDQALRQLMDAQQTKGSGNYHAWLTPEQFGTQYGPSDADVQTVTDWLTRQGFQVANVSKGRAVIEFSGNVAQVRNAFHTEMHRYVVNGKEHFANVSDPAIPAALSPVVAGVTALHNFPKHPFVHQNGLYRRYKGSNQLQPLFTYGNPANYAMGPGDFAKIYSIPTSATGAGQAIAVVSQTNINTQDIVDFRSMFGLPAYTSVCTSALPPSCQFSVIVNGTDPGIVGPTVVSCTNATDDEIEADLDAEWSGAIAPAANIYLVVSQSTCSNPGQVSQGVDLSALYAVDNNLAPVINDSYGSCEAGLLTTGNQFYNSLWEQAAAQGITVAVAAGDSGSAGCDPSTNRNAATQGIAISGLASTPYNVAVGGTDFDPSTAGNSTYWNTASDVINSAKSYIPETTWDDSACALAYPASCTAVDTTNAADISAGGGGPSNCVVSTSNGSGVTCTTNNSSYPNGGYPKPVYQQSNITPADLVRDIPDISFFASNGGPISGGAGVSYVVCQSDTNPQGSTTPTGASCNVTTPYLDFSLVGGTSAATPAFAGVMALVDQSTGQRQGNANYVLYNLAATDANYTGGKCASSLGQTPTAGCVFNDVTKGNNAVACAAGTPNCSNTSSTAGAYGVVICNTTSTQNGGTACPAVDNGTPAFLSSTKYDLATGLGSINVGNLLMKWTTAIRIATTTTVASPTGGSPAGTAFTATVNVTPTAASGNVSLIALDGSGNVLGTIGTDASGNPFTLTNGSATVTSNLLPAGTVSVEATYGGNTTYAISTSTPPTMLAGTVAGSGQTSTVTVYYVGFDSTGAALTPTTSSPSSWAYGTGSGYILKIVVTGSNGSCSFSYPNTKPAIPCPTGAIQLFDNGSPLTDFLNNGTATGQTSLNNQGFAEDQPINVPVGTHKITATYSGDKNYFAATTSNTLTLTLTQAPTSTTVAGNPSAVVSGGSVTLTAIVATTGYGAGPTGNVQFTNGSTSLGSAKCTPTAATSTAPSFCTATLTTTISSLYPPSGNGPRTPRMPLLPILVALMSVLLFALGWKWMPQPRRRAYAYAGLLAFALLAAGIAGCGGGGGGGGGGGSTRTITASYPGDTNYTSSSGTVPITVQ